MKTYGTGSRAARLRILVAATIAAGFLPSPASAQSGSWSQIGTGSVWAWGDTGNWTGGVVANGAGNTATFATASLTAPVVLSLDASPNPGPHTIGALAFDNPTNGFGWTIQGTGANIITLSSGSTPTISVLNTGGTAAAPVTATINAPLAGTQGFNYTGPGTLLLYGNNTGLSGPITISSGVVGVTSLGGANPLGSATINLAGGTLRLGDGSGYTQNMVLPVGATLAQASSILTATVDSGTQFPLVNYTWYAQGANTGHPTTGLIMGANINSAFAPNNTYSMPVADTTHMNVMLLDTAHPTGRFVMSNASTTATTISFLTGSGNAGTTLPSVTATIHYADGTPDAGGLTFMSPDWFTATNAAIQGNGQMGYNNVNGVLTPIFRNINDPAGTTSGLPFLTDQSITNPNPTHPISSIDLSWTVGSSATAHTLIFALSGGAGTPIAVSGGNPAQNFTNNVSVTADSTINVQTSLGAALGSLSIGSNVLTVNAGTAARPSLTLGNVTLTGNPTFNIVTPAATPQGLTTTISGTFSDGGTARTITKNGTGNLTIGASSPGLSANTAVVVNAGNLNLNASAAFGPSPIVTANGGSLNLGTTTNPTFQSLAGSGGNVNLNGNALTINPGTSTTFSGSLTDGSAAGSLVKSGAGTQTLAGASTYSGGTSVSAGTLKAIAGSLGTGTVTMAGGTLGVGVKIVPDSFGGIANTSAATGYDSNLWQANGSVSFPSPNLLQLTPAGGGTGSLWLKNQISTAAPFTIKFTMTNLINAAADGFTVGFQTQGTTAIGGGGGGQGFSGVSPSVAMQGNIYNGHPIGVNVVTNGVITDVTSSLPVNPGLQNQPTDFVLNYDGTNLSVALTQYTSTARTALVGTFSGSFPANFGALGGTALFGFTGATGGVLSQQQISNFSFNSAGYNSPTAAIQGVYNNNMSVTNSSTVTVQATATVPNVKFNNLSMAAGTTLNVNPDATNPAGTAFGLTFSGTSLAGAATLAISNTAAGTGNVALGALSNSANGSVTVTGGGNLSTAGGTLGGRLDLGTGNLSMSGVSLSVGSLVGTSGTLTGNATTGNAITLTLGGDNTSPASPYGGTIVDGANGGTLAIVKTGQGTVSLSGVNTYSGGTTISDGTLGVAADSALGTGPVTISALGTLSYTANTATNKTFNLGGGTLAVSGGATLTLNGGTLTGGFLSGAGTFASNAATGARFANISSTESVTIASNSTLDRFVNFTNRGILNVAGGLNDAAQPSPTFQNFSNQGGGNITINANTLMNIANFESFGVLTLSPGTGGNATQITNKGSSNMFFDGGSRTFLSIPSHAGMFDAGIDLNGHNAVVAGGLFVNNGYVVDGGPTGTATIIADFGSLVKGAGFYQNSVQTVNGGKFQSGNSPGQASFGSFTFGPGGVSNYIFDINNAIGTAGPKPDANGQVSGWGLVKAVQTTTTNGTNTPGNFSWTATAANKLSVSLDTLVNPTTSGTDPIGLMANFDPTRPYSWLAASWSGSYSGPTDPAALNASTAFDSSGFQNPVAGAFGWTFGPDGHSLSLTYTPGAVPEPGTLALTALAGLGLGWAARRRKAKA
jgi:autotransporter-associated beta strand protein